MLLAEPRSPAVLEKSLDWNHLLIRKLLHFRSLDPEDCRHLDRMLDLRKRTNEPRSTLIEQGEPPGEISVMLEGWAIRQKVLPDGSRQILAFHLPGDICEFNSLLGAAADTETCAITAVRSASITGRMLNELMANAPHVGQALWWDAFSCGAIQREWMINIIRRPADQRLAHLLCELQTRLSLVGLADPTGFASPLTQAHLANACGLTVEHTNRSLRKLRLQSGIAFEGGVLKLDDVDYARKFAGFDGRYILLREQNVSTPWAGMIV